MRNISYGACLVMVMHSKKIIVGHGHSYEEEVSMHDLTEGIIVFRQEGFVTITRWKVWNVLTLIP